MKKNISGGVPLFLFFLLISSLAFGQSITLTPIGDDITITKYGNLPILSGRRANGTPSSPTAVTSSSNLLYLTGQGFNGTGFTGDRATISLRTSQNWNTANNGTQISFSTTPNNTTGIVERMTIANDGNVGIGIVAPLEKLHVVGNIRSSNLAGVGVRNVYADANGTITDATQARSVVISPMSFQRMNVSTSGTFMAWDVYGDCHMSVGATDRLIAPIILPVGAIITGVTFYYTDTSPTSNFKMELLKSPTTMGINTSITSLFQNTTNANTFDISSNTSGVLNETVTAGNYYYFTIIITDVAGTNFSSPWATYMSVKGINVTYTY